VAGAGLFGARQAKKQAHRFDFTESFVMAQVCEICSKGPQFGNNISHAHNVTRRRWNPNLQSVKAKINGIGKRVRVCTTCIKAGKVLKG